VTAHDPNLHGTRLAALLAGVPPDAVAAAPGLARLLSSLINPLPAPAAPVVEPDPALIAQGRAEAEAAGHAAGRAAATAELAPLRDALAAAIAAVQTSANIDESRLSPLLAGLVKAVAEAVLMAELAAGGRVLEPLVAAALAEVAHAALPVLQAHPETLALIKADLPPGLVIQEDAALPMGHVVVSGPDYRIEAGLGERLSRVVEGLTWG
jgi:flagellar biosynthesis/type III secretory pathway protein FliH